VQVLAHPECPPDVLAEADYVGSTAGMIGFVKGVESGAKVVMVTECSMADNVAVEAPGVEFVRPCNLCPHMKRITVAGIRDSLLHMQHEVRVAPEVAVRARVAVERMLEVPA
jgi:quinolinate synthase